MSENERTCRHLSVREIVRFFDSLALERAPVPTIVCRTAAWLGRDVAVRDLCGAIIGFGPTGGARDTWPSRPVEVRAPYGRTVAVGCPSAAHDPVLLDRLAFVIAMAAGSDDPSDPASPQTAVQVLIGEHGLAAQRENALACLGLSKHALGQVVVAAGPSGAIDVVAERMRHCGVRVARGIWRKLEVLVTTGGDLHAAVRDIPRGVQLAIGGEHPLADTPHSLTEAVAAIRFSQPSTRDRGPYLTEEGAVVEFGGLHGYDVLTRALTPDQIDQIDDVRALDRALEHGGPGALAALDVVVSAVSVRHAARLIGAHHNSVAHRISQAERALGFSLADSYGRSRLFLALTLRRIRETAPLVD